MNEQRLDELWEETRERCIEWRLSPAMDRKIPSVREEEQFMYKKFAELIVKECAKVIRDGVQPLERGKMRATIAHQATVLEQHFGVEE